MRTVSLLSLNVLCGTFLDPLPMNRHIYQAKQIHKINPDILCIQECNNAFIENIYSRQFSPTHNLILQRRTTMDYIKKVAWISLLCTGVTFLFTPMIFALLNPYFHNFIMGNQKISNAIFVKKGLLVTGINSESFKTQKGDVLNLVRNRGWTECIISNSILIRNVHLNHQQSFFDKSQSFVTSQVTESFSNLARDRSIVVGDFNIENFSYPDTFHDVCCHLGPTYRKENPLAETNQDKRIDFVFSQNINVISSKKLTDLKSDHDGLFITFDLDK